MQEETTPRQRIVGHVVRNTFQSPQALSLMLVVILGLVFNVTVLGVSAVVWLLIGFIGIMAMLVANLRDDATVAAVLDSMSTSQIDVASIKNPRSRQRLQQATEYATSIKSAARAAGGGMAARLDTTANQISNWVGHIFMLARRIDLYEADSLLRRDLARVPHELKTLQQRAQAETNPHLKADLEASMQLYQTHLDQLRQLETAIKRATIQLDNTLAALGTVYAQVQLLDTRQLDGSRAERLRQSITSEINLLKDTIDSIDDVRQQSLHTTIQPT